MFVRIIRLFMIVALVLACCLTSIRILRASNTCVIIGNACVDNGCDSSGGECTDYPPTCRCQHIVPPPPR
jgi:hypothetical protein